MYSMLAILISLLEFDKLQMLNAQSDSVMCKECPKVILLDHIYEYERCLSRKCVLEHDHLKFNSGHALCFHGKIGII